jgi:hypothetical protein
MFCGRPCDVPAEIVASGDGHFDVAGASKPLD